MEFESGGCSASRCSSAWAGSRRASTSSTWCGVARAAEFLFQGAQFPAQRAARQGDRGVHRGGQGRPGNRRAALRAGQPVPPARRKRPRDPHAPAPARARRPRRRAARRGAVRARPGLPEGGHPRPRRGGVRQAARRRRMRGASALQGAARDLPAGEGLGQGRRRWRSGSSARPGQSRAQGDRRTSYCELAADRGDAFAARRRARASGGGAGGQPQVRARQPAAGRPRQRPRATCDRAIEALEAHRAAESGLPRAGRAAPARGAPRGRPAGGGPDAAARLPRALPVARPARRGVPVARSRRRGRRRPTSWCATNCGATRRCSAWTGCWRRRSSARPARSGAATSSWCATSCTATRGASRATAARTAASRRASSTGMCPACGGWETYPPRRTEEFDLDAMKDHA